LVDLLSQVDVFACHTPGIMCSEHHIDPIVDIAPFGMMIEFLSEQGNLRHKSKRLPKVTKSDPALKRSASIRCGTSLLPTGVKRLASGI
jgi:hypothetical protein